MLLLLFLLTLLLLLLLLLLFLFCCCFCWLCYCYCCCCCCCCCFCFKNYFKSFLKKGYSIENNSTVHNISVTWHIWSESEFDLIGRIYYVKVFHLLIFCLWHRISLRPYVLFFIFRKLKKKMLQCLSLI